MADLTLNNITASAEAPLEAGAAMDSMSTAGFTQVACKLAPVFAPKVLDYELKVPTSAVRVRLNAMSYTAGSIKIEDKIGNMRMIDLLTEGSTSITLTLHDHQGDLKTTYTFKVTKTDDAAVDKDSMTSIAIPPPPQIPEPAAHGHSHGGVPCNHDHGVADSNGHDHGDGKVCTLDHGAEKHGHSHGDGKVCTEDHGHGHGHGHGHEKKDEGHAHGHGHGHGEEKKEEHGHGHGDCGHGHGHGEEKKEEHGHGHS